MFSRFVALSVHKSKKKPFFQKTEIPPVSPVPLSSSIFLLFLVAVDLHISAAYEATVRRSSDLCSYSERPWLKTARDRHPRRCHHHRHHGLYAIRSSLNGRPHHHYHVSTSTCGRVRRPLGPGPRRPRRQRCGLPTAWRLPTRSRKSRTQPLSSTRWTPRVLPASDAAVPLSPSPFGARLLDQWPPVRPP